VRQNLPASTPWSRSIECRQHPSATEVENEIAHSMTFFLSVIASTMSDETTNPKAYLQFACNIHKDIETTHFQHLPQLYQFQKGLFTPT